MSRCICPNPPALDEARTVDAIPTGPVRCACCGSPIRLTCDGECSAEHIEASMHRARDVLRRSRVAGIVSGSAREPREAGEQRERRQPTPANRGVEHRCDRCGEAIPPARGRPSLSCDGCLTPTERKRRAGRAAKQGAPSASNESRAPSAPILASAVAE